MNIFVIALFETAVDWVLEWFDKDRPYAQRRKAVAEWLDTYDTPYPSNDHDVLMVLEALQLRDLIITSQVEALDERWRECTCRLSPADK